MLKKEKLKPGPDPKNPEDKAVILTVSLPRKLYEALLGKGLLCEKGGRKYGLSEFVQKSLEKLL